MPTALRGMPVAKPETVFSNQYCRHAVLIVQTFLYRKCASRKVGMTERKKECQARSSKAEEQISLTQDSQLRPWTHIIPTLDEVLSDYTWPEKVKDWMTFWGMFFNWLDAYQSIILIRHGKEPGIVSMEQMEWLQISPNDLQKLDEVVDLVVDRIPALIAMGAPVPDEIHGKKPWNIGMYRLKFGVDETGKQFWIRDKIEGANPLYLTPEEAEGPEPWPTAMPVQPWDGWDEGDFRAFMEKRRAHRQQQARFAQRQAEVGRWDYLTVSPMTDSRWAKDPPFYPIFKAASTHEEFMATVRLDGVGADPESIDLQIRDPEEKVDTFLEGVHYVPETVDYIRSIGHLVENEEDLIGPQESDVPSATMDEEFPADDQAPFAELGEDVGDGLEIVRGETFDSDDGEGIEDDNDD